MNSRGSAEVLVRSHNVAAAPGTRAALSRETQWRDRASGIAPHARTMRDVPRAPESDLASSSRPLSLSLSLSPVCLCLCVIGGPARHLGSRRHARARRRRYGAGAGGFAVLRKSSSPPCGHARAGGERE